MKVKDIEMVTKYYKFYLFNAYFSMMMRIL